MKVIKFPAEFKIEGELINEVIESINYLTSKNNKKIALDFSNIENTSKGDVLILHAQMEKAFLFKKNIYRFGNLPKNNQAKKYLRELTGVSHFKKELFDADVLNESQSSEKESYIDVDFIDSEVTTLKKIGFKDYYNPFYDFLIEIIANAVEHGIKQKDINWWMTHELDKGTRTRKYTFVDMGIGIAKSHRKAKLPLRYRFLSDKKIVVDSLSGLLGSSTKKENRGRGLPQLLDMVRQGFISDLQIVSNRVSLLCDNEGRIIAKKCANFQGTYFSWTLNSDNFKRWKKLK